MGIYYIGILFPSSCKEPISEGCRAWGLQAFKFAPFLQCQQVLTCWAGPVGFKVECLLLKICSNDPQKTHLPVTVSSIVSGYMKP